MDQIKKDNNDNIIELDALRKKKAEDFHLPEEKVATRSSCSSTERMPRRRQGTGWRRRSR